MDYNRECKCGFKFSPSEKKKNYDEFITIDDQIGKICQACQTFYLNGMIFNDWDNLWVWPAECGDKKHLKNSHRIRE